MPELHLRGHFMQTNFQENRTAALWQKFRRELATSPEAETSEFFSVEIYSGPEYFRAFDPGRNFVKWAAVREKQAGRQAEEFDALTIPAGQYAVFEFRGPATAAPEFYGHIYGEWLPSSPYQLDDRPHFAVMDEHYRPADPAATEKIYIPVRGSDNNR